MRPDVTADGFALDRSAVARAFHRAAATYDGAARLQRVVREELLSRLDGLPVRPARVLDLGAGTGAATVLLKKRYPRAQVVAADVAPAMAAAARARSRPWRAFGAVAADALALPLADACVDVVFSSLMLQWCEDPALAFAEARRVLRPGGLLLFASFGPGTLAELREAWAAADGAVHVNRFIDMHDLGGALQRTGFLEPVLDVDRHRLHYADAGVLMRELKAIGAHNVNAGRPRGLTGRRRLAAMQAAYERQREPAGLPATWEVVYGVAWSGEATRLPVAAETRIGIDALRGLLRGRR